MSLYDACTSTLTLQVADINSVLLNDRYRLTLSSTASRGIRDRAGNLLDGEINLPPSRRLSPQKELFPSGDGTAGGSLQLDFLVTDKIAVDGDFPTAGTGTPGTADSSPRRSRARRGVSSFAEPDATVGRVLHVRPGIGRESGADARGSGAYRD